MLINSKGYWESNSCVLSAWVFDFEFAYFDIEGPVSKIYGDIGTNVDTHVVYYS